MTFRRGFLILAVALIGRVGEGRELAVDVLVSGDAAGVPFGVELGPDGALYFTDIRSHRVLRVDLDSRRVTPAAGSGRRGYAGDGGSAVEAAMDEPYEVRFDGDGNMYVVEMKNNVVRRVDAQTKRISTIAGTGKAGFSGDGGPATTATFNQPHSIALDGRGGLLVADIGNHRIRRIDLTSGVVETIAGNGERVMPLEGQRAAGRPLLGSRALFVIDGVLWIALREGHSVWRMSLDGGVLQHVAGVGKAGYSGEGGSAVDSAFNSPKGIAVDAQENVYVVDSGNEAVRRIDVKLDRVTTLVGGRLQDAKLSQPHGICVGSDGSLFIGDSLHHRVLRVK